MPMQQSNFSPVKEKNYKTQDSLFKKYAKLVTWFANTKDGQDYLGIPYEKIALMLPNGYHAKRGDRYQATFYSGDYYKGDVYAQKLDLSLLKIDIMREKYPLSFEDLKTVLLMDLGLKRLSFEYPQVYLDTATFNPGGASSTAVDGQVARVSVDEAFATIRAGSGNYAAYPGGASDGPTILATATSNQYGTMVRSILLYDTSSLGANANISAATESIYVASKTDQLAQNIVLTNSSPASNSALAVSDYQNPGTTEEATGRLDITNITTSAYNDFTLSATGIASIAKTGITKHGLRSSGDFDNSAPTWASGQTALINMNYSSISGGANKPKLVVTYTLPATTTEQGYSYFM